MSSVAKKLIYRISYLALVLTKLKSAKKGLFNFPFLSLSLKTKYMERIKVVIVLYS